MAAPVIEEQIVLAVQAAIAGITSPAIKVTQTLEAAAAMPIGSALVIPVSLVGDSGSVGKRRWHFTILVFLRGALCTGVAASKTPFYDVLAMTRAVLDAIHNYQGIRSAGAEQVRRGDVTYWCRPPGDSGTPAGAFFEVTADWEA